MAWTLTISTRSCRNSCPTAAATRPISACCSISARPRRRVSRTSRTRYSRRFRARSCASSSSASVSGRSARSSRLACTRLSDPQEDAFAQALDKFSKKLWRKPRARRKFRFDLAMLADGNDPMPPSNKRALKRFVDAGAELGIEVDTISKNDYTKLAEYDGLFIRETTALDNHTYRFSNKAEKEDMVVIDDPSSILKCTNKIYLHDLLTARKLPTPKDRDPLSRRSEEARRAAGPPRRFPDRAEDSGWLVFARHRQGRKRRAAESRSRRSLPAHRARARAGIHVHRVRLAHRRAQSRASLRVQVLHVARPLADLQPHRERHRTLRRLRDATRARSAGRRRQARAPRDRGDRRRACMASISSNRANVSRSSKSTTTRRSTPASRTPISARICTAASWTSSCGAWSASGLACAADERGVAVTAPCDDDAARAPPTNAGRPSCSPR